LSGEVRKTSDELDSFNKVISAREDCDVVIDFTDVQILVTVCIKHLMVLRSLLRGHGHRLILCGLSNQTKGIFTLAGLDGVFEFAVDKDTAVAAIQQAN
ncbi:MAG: STAS domain-containing protein, partial [Planctomycetota bacterium]|jgi:anti-anti-sigma regulatory factor